MGHHGRAAVSDFPSLEPSAESGTGAAWTAAVASPVRTGRSPQAPAASISVPTLELLDPGGADDDAPGVWREALRPVRAAASTVAGWLEPPNVAGPAAFSGLSPRSVTQGWPHHGSTVIRLVWAPADRVAAVLVAPGRWAGLRLGRRTVDPRGPDHGWTMAGRLRVPWTAVPVRVELQVQPAYGDRTWVHLVLTSRARFPRQYWAGGHVALAAIDRATRPPRTSRAT